MVAWCNLTTRRMACRLFATLFLLLAGRSMLCAQPVEYKVGVGLKVGSPCAVSVKYMASARHALELLAGGWLHAGGATVLYEYHVFFPSAPSLRWYLGGGAHCAYAMRNRYNPYAERFVQSNLYAGLDAVLGIEYVFPKVPFSFSLDALPVLNLTAGASLWWNMGATFRYTFR